MCGLLKQFLSHKSTSLNSKDKQSLLLTNLMN